MKAEFNLGAVSAYADAVRQGYTGTREQFAKDQANFAKNAAQVAENLQESKGVLEAAKGDIRTEAAGQIENVRAAGAVEQQAVREVADGKKQEISDAGAVLYGMPQTLTEEQKAQARMNIGAVGKKEADTLSDEIAQTNETLFGNGIFLITDAMLERGTFNQDEGKKDNTKRLRMINPIYCKKGSIIKFNIGNLYANIYELSTNETTGGNVLMSTGFVQHPEYTTKHDGWLYLTFANGATSADSTNITVSDFADYNVCSVPIQSLGKDIDILNTALSVNGIFCITDKAIESGGFTSANGKEDSTMRIRMVEPIFCSRETIIKFNISNLYAYIYELGTSDTTGGNVLKSKGWVQPEEYTMENDAWLYIMFANSSTSSGSTKISVSDFAGNSVCSLVNKGGSAIGGIIKNKNNPYKDVVFESDERIATTTHVHCTTQTTLNRLVNKGLGAVAISNYYPSKPFYPLDEQEAITNVPDVIEIPNAEHHGFTNISDRCHFNSIGSLFSSGKPSGETPAGANDTWQHTVTKIKRELLYADGGGVTINHPVWTGLTLGQILEILDYDEIVLGLEIFNQSCEVSETNHNTGWALSVWDDVLKTGRRCWGFAVPDHYARGTGGSEWQGKIEMLIPDATQEECLKAIRNGAFYSKINHTDLALTDLTVTGQNVTLATNKTATIRAIVDGETALTVSGTIADITVPNDSIYVRFEVETAEDTIYTNPIMFQKKLTT